MAVVDELELVGRLHFTVDVLAFWDDSVGDKLIPRRIKTCISEETRLEHHFGADESQRFYEVSFIGSLRANFSIDMNLDERRV